MSSLSYSSSDAFTDEDYSDSDDIPVLDAAMMSEEQVAQLGLVTAILSKTVAEPELVRMAGELADGLNYSVLLPARKEGDPHVLSSPLGAAADTQSPTLVAALARLGAVDPLPHPEAAASHVSALVRAVETGSCPTVTAVVDVGAGQAGPAYSADIWTQALLAALDAGDDDTLEFVAEAVVRAAAPAAAAAAAAGGSPDGEWIVPSSVTGMAVAPLARAIEAALRKGALEDAATLLEAAEDAGLGAATSSVAQLAMLPPGGARNARTVLRELVRIPRYRRSLTGGDGKRAMELAFSTNDVRSVRLLLNAGVDPHLGLRCVPNELRAADDRATMRSEIKRIPSRALSADPALGMRVIHHTFMVEAGELCAAKACILSGPGWRPNVHFSLPPKARAAIETVFIIARATRPAAPPAAPRLEYAYADATGLTSLPNEVLCLIFTEVARAWPSLHTLKL